ncbi:hypothetical protein [Microvirga rosea]|uniref:hypothetical protein n=1 Tax=Microvirga rosea TaxID=2715425 RepID=UPI001D0A883E|nr:hypothetical protein [Microvirga rosea]MCB8822416.1 hypothetical protein [Microvirga rosea]
MAVLPLYSGMSEAWAEEQGSGECVLDVPEPVFAKGGFALDGSRRAARETLRLNGTVVVHLEQTQCEYRTQIYTFAIKGLPEETEITGWQYRKAVDLLSLLEARSIPKLKFTAEKKALRAYEQLVADAKPDVDINIRPPHDQFSELISVSAQTGGQDHRITVKIWSGPY